MATTSGAKVATSGVAETLLIGIARNVDDVTGLTVTAMEVGTVAYSAPEQLMGNPIDGRADQYALAATANHLLTGAQLFPNAFAVAVIRAPHRPAAADQLAAARAAHADIPGQLF